MKKTVFSFLALICIAFSVANGQSADEIIKRHIDAHGGAGNWDKIENMKVTGQFTSFSEIYPFTEIKTSDGAFYSSHNLGHHPVKEGSANGITWRLDPWFELGHPHIANEAETHTIVQKSEFCSPFYRYKERGFTVSYEGLEKIDGTQMHKLILNRGNGQPETWYLDPDTYLEYKAEGLWMDFGYPSPAEFFFDDFRKVGDVIMPFYIERMFSIRYRETEIESVEFNIETDPAIFEIAKSDEILKLGFMAGSWQVVVEALTRRGDFMTTDTTRSEIDFVPNKNLLVENMTYTVVYRTDRIMSWTYHDETAKYRASVFNDFYSVMNMFQGDFAGDSLVVSNEAIRYGEDHQPDRSTRYVYKDISDDGFLLELQLSTDGGETWITRQKFTYTRQD